jgi:hypothetical protein
VMAALNNAEVELEKERLAAMERARLAKEARKAGLLAKANYITQDVSPFDHNHKRVTQDRVWSRDGREFSPAQLKIFNEAGYDASKFEYRQGQAIIGKLMKDPSPKMVKTLESFGFDPVGDRWDRLRCKKEIGILEANNWRLPQPI